MDDIINKYRTTNITVIVINYSNNRNIMKRRSIISKIIIITF